VNHAHDTALDSGVTIFPRTSPGKLPTWSAPTWLRAKTVVGDIKYSKLLVFQAAVAAADRAEFN